MQLHPVVYLYIILKIWVFLNSIALTSNIYFSYKTKHEFYMNLSGKILFVLSSIFVTVAKLSGQIILNMAMYSWILPYDNVPLILLTISFFIHHVFYAHAFALVNYWLTSRMDGGYFMTLKFLPITSSISRVWTGEKLFDFVPNSGISNRLGFIFLLCILILYIASVYALISSYFEVFYYVIPITLFLLIGIYACMKYREISSLAMRTFPESSKHMKPHNRWKLFPKYMNWSWFIIGFLGDDPLKRRQMNYGNVYGFNNCTESRIKFRKRIGIGLGMHA